MHEFRSADDGLRGRRVLVLEEDELVAGDLRDALEAAGAEVVGPTSRVSGALALLDSDLPDCAVLVVDLDGTLTSEVAARLAIGGIPFVLAMEDIRAHPEFWTGVPRLQKPVTVSLLGDALTQEAAKLAKRSPEIAAIFVRLEAADSDRPRDAIPRDRVAYPKQWRTGVEATKDRPPQRLSPGEIPTIDLDATHWRNVLDLNAALKQALGSIEGHGNSPDAWVDSILYGGMNAVEPPYVVRITGTSNCRAGLMEEINLLAEIIREARRRKLDNYGEDVEVSFHIEP